MVDAEGFELSISEILQENDFEFFYQFEISLSTPDYYGMTKRVPDYVAAYKGLYLVIDAKAWNEVITPPALNSASGKVKHTIGAIDKLFWDTCLFETGLLNSWEAKCPNCQSTDIFGNTLPVKGPKEVGEQDMYVYVDDEATPFVYYNFGCKDCDEVAKNEGFKELRFKSWELFPTVVPLIVSKTPFKTQNGFEPFNTYVAPQGGYFAMMGEAPNHCQMPKTIVMCQITKLDEVLKQMVSEKKYPQTLTLSLEELHEKLVRAPVNPNKCLVAFTSKKRKESAWLTVGKEALEKLRQPPEDVLSDEEAEELG
jgi:hypothetical protein